MRFLLTISFIWLLFFSCKKDNHQTGGSIEIYLLTSYELVPGKCEIKPLSAVLQNTPLVHNNEILEYSATTYEYRLSDSAIRKIKLLLPRIPFALTVDKQVIFYGMNVPRYISSTCDHSIVMTTGLSGDNKVQMLLGYPGISLNPDIDDQRNNEKLLAVLALQGKLR